MTNWQGNVIRFEADGVLKRYFNENKSCSATCFLQKPPGIFHVLNYMTQDGKIKRAVSVRDCVAIEQGALLQIGNLSLSDCANGALGDLQRTIRESKVSVRKPLQDCAFPRANIQDSVMRNFLTKGLNIPHLVLRTDLSLYRLTAVLVVVQVSNRRCDTQCIHDSPPSPDRHCKMPSRNFLTVNDSGPASPGESLASIEAVTPHTVGPLVCFLKP